MNRYMWPLAIFLILCGLLYVGLGLNPREVPSPLVDKPAPPFTLPSLHQEGKTISPADFKGQVWLLNVWASWCTSCRAEHELIVDMVRQHQVAIVGLNYKDQDRDAKYWLKRFGDPYTASAVDAEGEAGIDWGVYGVPETFVIDRRGMIRHKHIGPLTAESIRTKILPLLKQLEGESA